MRTRALIRRLIMIAGALTIALSLQAKLEATGNCSDGWVLCSSDSFDFDGSTWPGIYIESENGTGRFGMGCGIPDQNCFIFNAYWYAQYNQWGVLDGSDMPYLYYGSAHMVMDDDGNLEVWNSNYSVLWWESDTDVSDTGAHLIIDDEGCANIYNHDESSLLYAWGCSH